MSNQIPSGARTSDFYRTDNIPERFNNPADIMSQQPRQQSYNAGNPVASCVISPPSKIMHERADDSKEWFKGYSEKVVHPLYRTTAMDYGGKKPNVHTMPTVYYTRSSGFTEHLGKTGMYRNQSFNTDLPGSKHV